MQIGTALEWALDPIQESLPLALQLQFIETLLTCCLGGNECFNTFIAASNYGNNFMPTQTNSSLTTVDPSIDGNGKEGGNTMKQKEWTESIGKWFNKDEISRFAISLYLRWVVRSLQKINLPLPPLNKQQIYSTSGLPGCNFMPTVIDPNIAAQISATIPCALKILETELDKNRSLSQILPGYKSFWIRGENVPHSNSEVECSDDNSHFLPMVKGAWRSMILFDLATYNFYTENYSKCRKYLKNIRQLQVENLQQIVNIDLLNGYTIAVGGEVESKEDQVLKRGREDKNIFQSEDIVEAIKKIESSNGIESSYKNSKDIPMYRRINIELAAIFKGGNNNSTIAKALEKLTEANITMRLKECLPQNSEFFRSGYKILNSNGTFSKQKDQKLFLQYLSGIKKLDYSKEPIDVDVDKPWNKIKHTKIKKRDILLSLLREMQKPEKIYKLLQDLTKVTSGSTPLFINRIIPRYTNSDGGQIVDLYVGASSGASIHQQQLDSNYVFLLMAKANQLVELKAFEEAITFYNTVAKHVDNSCSNKQQASIIKEHISIQIMYTKMLQLADERNNIQLLGTDENKKRVKSFSNSALQLEVSNKLKERVIFIAANCQEHIFGIQIGSVHLLETAFVTLLNLGEFDFVLASCRKEGAGPGGKLYQFRNLVNIASLISSCILHIRNQVKQLQSGSRLNGNLANANDLADFKKTCKGLYEILLPCVQTSVTATKRGRGGNDLSSNANKSSRDKAWYLRFLKRLNRTEVLTMLASLFISIYNASVEDSSHEIQLGSSGSDLGLPALPISHNSSADINEDAVLSLISLISSKGSKKALTQGVPWVRIEAEVNFAQGNYLAALRFYIQSLMLTTHYFQKPWTKDSVTSMTLAPSGETNSSTNPLSLAFSQNPSLGNANSLISTGGNGWDDRIFHKMIKCTTELGHHATTVVLCQFLGTDSADYPTAFRALEDRGSNDCMDDMYPFLWDVTALEYTVSMHTKRGELSRKRKALETISQLEINTNNNEEILREARATRRSAFLRYMAAAFL